VAELVKETLSCKKRMFIGVQWKGNLVESQCSMHKPFKGLGSDNITNPQKRGEGGGVMQKSLNLKEEDSVTS